MKTIVLALAFLFSGCAGNKNLPTNPYEQVVLWSKEINIKQSAITSINCTRTDSGHNTACSINYLLGEGLHNGRSYLATELLLCHEKRGCQKIPIDEYGNLYIISEEQ
jgi:hypothetical protein